ncbi:SpoIIE family protein phosphatase [Phytoactinopolyspora mesophila]|uniref:SpoIIE family protein phosphatase n=1 Tax=Phytoactinopolyspora mesophila TaxID=2650750 RepID=A0A7K3LZV3_9ACTN|nr:SpoIIE family protein phosphatase [Phytoactinopolyspora mesophila]
MRPADAQRLLGALAGADAPVGFAVFDDQYRYLAINAFLAERTGKTIADHLGRRPSEVLPPELSAHTEAMIDRVLRSGETVKADEPPVPNATGSVPYLRSTWYLVSEADRREVAMFVVDDTSQRSALSALRHSRARNARLLEVAEELAEAVTVADVAAAITVIGRATVGARWIGLTLLGEPGDFALDGPYVSHWPDDAVTPMAEVIRTGWPVFLPSKARARDEFAHEGFRAFLDQTDEEAWAVLPLTADSGRIGAVRFAFSTEQPFESEVCRFLRAVAQQCSVALERALLFEQERTATASLTEGLKPPMLPIIDGLEVGARSLPGSTDHVVGGDWYDVFELPDGTVSVVVGDVMGHGLSAASGMGQLRAALRALALTDADPVAVLTGLDRLVDGGGAVELATVVYFVIDPREGVVRLGDAGHLPMVRIPRDDELELIDSGTDTTPIGVAEPRFSRRIRLGAGEILLAFTDGLVESRSRSLEEGVTELLDCLEEHRQAPLDVILDTVVERLRTAGASDDLTVLALRWRG